MKTWTTEEIDVLIQNYNVVSNETLATLIPNRTKQGIYKKAYKLGLRKFIRLRNGAHISLGKRNWFSRS